ncbi:MAG: chemotaxis protein CheW [Alsobacter sp.]
MSEQARLDRHVRTSELQRYPAQVVTFRVADRLFGVDVSVVREIKSWQPTTSLPDTEAHVLGVINLRGQIVPVYDLRLLIGLDQVDSSAGKVVVVLDVEGQPHGIVADDVSDILDVGQDEFRPSPVATGERELVSTLIVKNESVISLMNPGFVSSRSSLSAH